MVIITGAAGFIGSCVAKDWKDHSDQLIIVDDFERPEKQQNLRAIDSARKIDRNELFESIDPSTVEAFIHLGARTDTTEFDERIFNALNVEYSKRVWQFCTSHDIPLVYASSAATYGDGAHGYDDDHGIVDRLEPLNPYGISKNVFDQWALSQDATPPVWYGLKFFNVYGPNEYHKGRMASVVYHAFRQIQESGGMKLFRSHHHDYKDGEQLRDFVYVKDVVSIIRFLLSKQPESGLYNVGTGEARTFNALVKAVFDALEQPANISYVDTPSDIRDKYQYFTEANMDKLRDAGYAHPFTSLESGVSDYVKHYLVSGAYY